MSTVHNGETGKTHVIELTSALYHVTWAEALAAPGGTVRLDVTTGNVGNGADVTIKLQDGKGKSFGTFKDHLVANRLSAQLVVPQDAQDALIAEVELPKHGLKGTSEALLLMPPVEIKDLTWSAEEARRGDILTMEATVEGAYDGSEATITIFEHDQDGAHDLITTLSTLVVEGEVAMDWTFEYHEDVDDIPAEGETEQGYNAPEYFFRVEVGGLQADSDILLFKDWIEIELTTFSGSEEYILHLPDGSQRTGAFKADGTMREEDIPPGPFHVEVIQKG